MQTSLHPSYSVLQPWHRKEPAAEALTLLPLTESVPVGETKEDSASLSLAARSAGTPVKGPHGTSFLLASRHLPDDPYSPKKPSLQLEQEKSFNLVFQLLIHSFIQ